MFGFISANLSELSPEETQRYNAVYCGICRELRMDRSKRCRMVLSYDMTFLALLLMSLYEPAEELGSRACRLHPLKPRGWVDNEYVRYAADMNLVLAYYKCQDDWADDGNRIKRRMAEHLQPFLEKVAAEYPRQVEAVRDDLLLLSKLEAGRGTVVDGYANAFGMLMSELLVCREDMWAADLRELGLYLGRFIYLADALVDRKDDRKRGKFNPLNLAGGDDRMWEDYLVLAMGKATAAYERLPLVQDKAILDNILYSGVWRNFRKLKGKESQNGGSV